MENERGFDPSADHGVVTILTLARVRSETFGEPERTAKFFVNRVRTTGKQVQQIPSKTADSASDHAR
jgi:hypothetical protein